MGKLVFDIGASNTKYAWMTGEAEIRKKGSFPTCYRSKEEYFGVMTAAAEQLKKEGAEFDRICVSTNGRMEPDGVTYRAYTMNILKGVDLKQELEHRTGLPVSVLNDGFAAAVGEWKYGAGRGCDNMMGVVLGSGMGAGLILNGRLYEGKKKNAAMVFGMLSACGKESCEISGIATSFIFLLYQLAQAKQCPMEEMTGEKFFEYLEAGDPVAEALFHEYTRSVAVVVFNSALLLDLERVVITGGLSSREILIREINARLAELPEYISSLSLISSGLVLYDKSDVEIQVVQGELQADANLYGAYSAAE